MKGLPSFLAIDLSEPFDEFNNAFTPNVMVWDEHSLLMDLSTCRKYWGAIASHRGIEAEGLIVQLLQELYRPRNISYRAVLASDPWRAALLMHHMRDRSLGGLLNLESHFAQVSFQQMTWQSWFSAADVLASKHKIVGTPRFNMSTYLRQRKLMAASSERLSLKGPYHLAQAESLAIKRRFGATLARFWELTFPQASQFQPSLFDESNSPIPDFPWITWQPLIKPSVRRYLDDPVYLWSHIEPILCEDLDRLCQDNAFQYHEKVAVICWQIHLSDSQTLSLFIRFRNPHSLHKERGAQKTALLQASYVFADAYQFSYDPGDDADNHRTICGWDLVVEKRITIPDSISNLFGDFLGDSEEAKIIELENLLPVPLLQYSLCSDWLPEESFILKNQSNSLPLEAEYSPPWVNLAKSRAMFFYKEPVPLDISETDDKAFLERVSTKWWGVNGKIVRRDYYRYSKDQRKSEWVYQDSDGKWYAHGYFG